MFINNPGVYRIMHFFYYRSRGRLILKYKTYFNRTKNNDNWNLMLIYFFAIDHIAISHKLITAINHNYFFHTTKRSNALTGKANNISPRDHDVVRNSDDHTYTHTRAHCRTNIICIYYTYNYVPPKTFVSGDKKNLSQVWEYKSIVWSFL